MSRRLVLRVIEATAVASGAPEAYQRIWRWHAVAELEHKSVVFVL